ncbi:MAG: MFS transporter [Chloroflexota bacterium]|nr:MFS transporter [Chloroflexota bacterium]
MTDRPVAIDLSLAEEPLATSGESDTFQLDQVLTIGVGHLTHDIFTAFLAPLLPLIQTRLGLGYAMAGSLAIFAQLPSLLNPFIGYMADRVSVRYFVILAPGVSATLYSLIGLAPSYAALAILLFAAGISIAAFHAPAPAMVAKVSGPRVGTGMSVFMASGELARAIGPIFAVAGVAWFGLEGIWRLAVLGWLVSAFLFVRLRRVPATPRTPGNSDMADFWHTARRVFPSLTWLVSGRIFMLAAVTTYLPIYMSDEREAGLWMAAAALTILEAAGVAGALLAGTLSDRLGRKRVLLVLMSVAPLLLFAFVSGPEWLAVPLLVALGFTAISPQPVLLALVQDQFPRNRALANGTFLAISFVVRAAGIWLVGVIADSYGLNSAFAFSAFFALFSIPSVFLLPSKEVE